MRRQIGERPIDPVKLLLGVLLIATGLALWLARLGYFDLGHLARYWPVLLIGWGAARMVDPAARRRAAGLVPTVAGVLLLLDSLRLYRIRDTWPFFLIAIGAAMVLRSMLEPRPGPTSDGEDHA